MKKTVYNIKREFASYSFKCPYKCKHCYTFSKNFKNDNCNDIDEIINNLKNKDFNIIYISGYTENFVEPSKGIDLIEKIYNQFKCDILFTTRNVFSNKDIERLEQINYRMRSDGKVLISCVSISAWDSYKKLEDNPVVPSPQKRIDFLRNLHLKNIITILTIRPVCPSQFINTEEYLSILKKGYHYCDAVISSGIIVNDEIRKQLYDFPNNIKCVTKPIMNCLQQQNMLVDYVDTEKELKMIFELCKNLNIPHFYSSIPAVEYIYQKYKN